MSRKDGVRHHRLMEDKRHAYSMTASGGRCAMWLERDYLSASRCRASERFASVIEWLDLDCGGLVDEAIT
jgi:hypothetical protein